MTSTTRRIFQPTRWRALTTALFLALPALLGASLHAGPVKNFSFASARDFLAGDSSGVAISAEGRLSLGPKAGKREWPEEAADAVIFATAYAKDGRLFLATGGGSGRLFVSDPGKGVRLVFESTEPNLTAVAVSSDGTVVCGASPNGAVYRVDPSSKEPAKAGTVWAEPNEAAIWALAFSGDGSLFIGTGNKGRIFRRDPKGKTDLFAEIEDTHVRTLAAGKDGSLVAGTSDKGMVVSLTKDGTLRTLHDFSRPEVTGLAIRPDGSIYAASSAVEVPSLASRTAPQGRSPVPTPTPTPATQETPKGTVSVTTSPVRLLAGTGPSGPSSQANAEVVLILPDGAVEPAWGFPDEAIYGISLDPKTTELLIAAGPKGRLYSLADRELRLLVQTEERQVVAGYVSPSGPVLATMSAPAVFRTVPSKDGVYTSSVRDAGRVSTAHGLRMEGQMPAGSKVALALRSGNSAKPDKSWAAWVDWPRPAGASIPAGRYFQWRATLTSNDKGEAPTIERVDMSYSERNSRPVIENLAILEPNAVFPRGAASSGPAVLAITNPDEQGIFSGVEPPREAPGDPGAKRLFRKGFRTVAWKGTDLNGDPLRYDVEIKGVSSGIYFNLRKEVEDSHLSFDTTAIPDGRYRIRVTASDRLNRPEGLALTAVEESESFVVDNSPPVLKITEAAQKEGQLSLSVSASDGLAPILKAEGTVNGDRWRLLTALDGASDSQEEKFTVKVPKPSGPAFVSIRVVDTFGNSTAISAEYPRDFK